MTDSFPDLLQEWIDWWNSFSSVDPVGPPNNLVKRTEEAFERHQKSIEFFKKSHDNIWGNTDV